jgi:hypothetical protein
MLLAALAIAFPGCGDDENTSSTTAGATTQSTSASTETTNGASTEKTTKTEATTSTTGSSTEAESTSSTTTTAANSSETSQGEPATGKVFPVRFVLDGDHFRKPTTVTVKRGYAIELIVAAADNKGHKAQIVVRGKSYRISFSYGFGTVRIPAPKPGRYTLIADGPSIPKATIVVR